MFIYRTIFKVLFLISFFYGNLQAFQVFPKDDILVLLKPKDTSIAGQKSCAGNVIQGIANFDNFWITTQTDNDNFLLINFFDMDGKSIFNTRINYPSHGQDLSIEYIKKQKLLRLYTVSTHWKGIVAFDFIIEDKKISYLGTFNEIDLECKHCTSTIDTTGNFFAVKDGKYITIYDKKILLEKNKQEAITSKFKLDPRQTIKGQYFQGIEMKEDIVYCLTSSTKLEDIKYIFAYNLLGQIVYVQELTFGKDFAKKEGNKYELEGLTFMNNSLYTTVMTGKNIKRLYKILEIK